MCVNKIVCQKFISYIIAFLKSHFGHLANSVDQGKDIHCCFFSCSLCCCIICKLVDMRVTCINLLKIASDGKFNLHLKKKILAYSKLASAKFDPYRGLNP